MTRPILLDTCAALWLASGGLAARAEAELNETWKCGADVFVSPITAWEIGLLVSKGRVALSIPPLAWFEALLEEGVRLAEMSPQILIASSQLPGAVLRDPADRIIAATARAFGYRLMTRDRPLLDFADAGHAAGIAC